MLNVTGLARRCGLSRTTLPDEHQEFLEFLHIPGEEIRQIREWSRKGERRS